MSWWCSVLKKNIWPLWKECNAQILSSFSFHVAIESNREGAHRDTDRRWRVHPIAYAKTIQYYFIYMCHGAAPLIPWCAISLGIYEQKNNYCGGDGSATASLGRRGGGWSRVPRILPRPSASDGRNFTAGCIRRSTTTTPLPCLQGDGGTDLVMGRRRSVGSGGADPV